MVDNFRLASGNISFEMKFHWLDIQTLVWDVNEQTFHPNNQHIFPLLSKPMVSKDSVDATCIILQPIGLMSPPQNKGESGECFEGCGRTANVKRSQCVSGEGKVYANSSKNILQREKRIFPGLRVLKCFR